MRKFLNHKQFLLDGGAMNYKINYNYLIIQMEKDIYDCIYFVLLVMYILIEEGMNMYFNENTSKEK